MIDAAWRPRDDEYMGGIIHGLGGVPVGVGGVADHVHLLVGLKSTHCLADFVRELKKSATAWVHGQADPSGKFAWQSGYAAFTVSATSRPAVCEYILHQEEHHRVKSFREELEAMLAKAGVPYDPKFLDG